VRSHGALTPPHPQLTPLRRADASTWVGERQRRLAGRLAGARLDDEVVAKDGQFGSPTSQPRFRLVATRGLQRSILKPSLAGSLHVGHDPPARANEPSPAEGPNVPAAVLTELKNRGVEDVPLAVWYGLEGLPEAITTIWEFTQSDGHLLLIATPSAMQRQD
jgi:hypothetical protein